MATIKDIARAAGVSQGTVSNVLNGKGNVSSTKIRQVQQAAQQLGYALNQRAQVLRRGSSKTLAVVLPSLYNRCYVDFFTSFRNYAQNCGYQVSLLLTDDQPEKEERAIGEIQSGMMAGTAAFTCLHDDGAAYAAAGVQHICFVERSPGSGAPALGFDYYALGCDMARRAIADVCRNPAALLESHAFSSQSELLRGLRDVLDARGLPLTCRQTESSQCAGDAFDLLGAEVAPDAIFIGNYAFAQTLRSIIRHFHEGSPRLYSVSPLFALPMGDFTEFEMNYRLLGRRAAERLIALIEDEGAPAPLQALPVDGVRSWLPPVCGKKKARRLSILTQDSPSINILRNVSRLYTRETGTEISFAAYSYDGLSEVLSSIENTAAFDLARLDSKRWPYYMERVYTPLKEIDPDIESIFDTFVPGLSRKYSHMNGTLYALPNTTSAQLLFYRRDLFESTAFRRRYSEMYNCELLPPTTYQEYNRIAQMVRRLGMQDQVIVKSRPTQANFDMVAEVAYDLPYMPFVYEQDDTYEMLSARRDMRYSGVEAVYSTDDAPLGQRAYVDALHALGKKVWINAIRFDDRRPLAGSRCDDTALCGNPDDSWGWMARQGYDIIQTDWTLQLNQYLRSIGY